MEERKKLEKLREKQKNLRKVEVNVKDYLPAAVAVTVIMATLIAGLQMMDSNTANQRPDIEGKITNVTVNDVRATPSRPTISPEDGVRFTNTGSHYLNFTFERGYESFTLKPDESKVIDINMIVYYDVEAVEDESFRIIQAGINVQ